MMNPLLIGLLACSVVSAVALICLFMADFSVSDPWQDDQPGIIWSADKVRASFSEKKE